MSRETFDQLRRTAVILLLLVVTFIVVPRDRTDPAALEATGGASPTASVVLVEVGGEVSGSTAVSPEPSPSSPLPSPTATATPPSAATPTGTPPPTATPSATPAPTPVPDAAAFSAEVLTCTSISGSACNGQLAAAPVNAGSFVALVRFTNATAGDELNAILDGPSGAIPGFPYTVTSAGDGYYYSQFEAGGLPAGDYTVTATRNGEPVATTSFTKAGG